MSPLLAGALSGLVGGAATSLLATVVHRRLLCGPRGSRWCARCWARAVVLMDGWDTCLYCGDSAWHRAHDLETGTDDLPASVTTVELKPGTKLHLVRPRRLDTTT